MIYEIVSVHDRAAAAYGRPIFTQTTGQAIRSFQDEINRNAPDNTMFAHPEDFVLFHLGNFDDATGTFNNVLAPAQLAYGKQLKHSN